jgi:hypothetical protein
MVKITYTYSFNELSGKPKRFIEKLDGCKILGYGVSTDTVTLIVLFDSSESYDELNKLLNQKFKLKLKNKTII